MSRPVAPQLAGLVERLIGAPLPVRIRAWDGSEAGSADGPVAIIRHRRALRRLLWNPGELGLARAFVAGELDVEGDVAEGLSRFWKLAKAQDLKGLRPSASDVLDAAKLALRLGVVGPRPKPPASEARLSGGLHTRRRDRAAIAHHYDLSNDFYEFLLDPQMAYSCGYWTQESSATYGLVDAQRDKLDLICRKLGLKPGMRLLDVGCGWASLLVHAAQHYGVTAVGVTLSAQQRAYGLARVEAAGLTDKVEIRLQDYREVADQPFDAISSIEMGEHVGQDNYPVYAAQLQKLLLPGGRLLLQQMSRGAAGGNSAPGGGAFMESYVAPDMFMRPLGSTLNFLEEAGLEVVDVHSLREHYVWTVRPWLDTLQERRAEAVALIGEEQWRVWLLYLAGAALAFEENRMGVHQMLLVRPDAEGRSGLPRGRTSTLGRDPELDHALRRITMESRRRARACRSRHDKGMSDYPWGALLTNLWVTALVVVAVFGITLFVAVRVRGGRHDGIDVVWGAGFAIVAIVTLLLALGDGDLWRQLLITALTCIWGFRLAWHIERRNRGKDEDPRYVAIKNRSQGHPVVHMVRKVYLPQIVIQWVVSLPVQLGQYGHATTALSIVVTVLGVLSWGTGFFFESVGDAQLAAFTADPANKGKVMDKGLWRYTRHPNYFGDAAVWWGLTLLAMHHAAGLIGLISVALMTWLLAKGTGAKLLESSIGRRRPGYEDYVKRTSGFIPLPPKKVVS